MLEQIRDGADMVFVTVSNHHTPDFLLILQQVGKIRDHQVHPQHIRIGEGQAAVHHQNIIAAFIGGEVFSDLSQSAQRNDLHAGLAGMSTTLAPVAVLPTRI